MKAVITGATGFIGSHLVRHLASKCKYTLFSLVRPTSNTKKIAAYIADKIVLEPPHILETMQKAFDTIRPDVLIHLAARSWKDDERERIDQLIEANITLGTFLLEAAATCGVRRFINTGTFWECMGDPAMHRAVDLYAASKTAFGNILAFYGDAHDIKAITLRLFNTYGPFDNRLKVFSLFEQSIDSLTPLPFSPGQQILDLTHVDDVVRAYEKAITYIMLKESPDVEVFEIGSGEGHTLREVARIYEECRGRRLRLAWGKRDYRFREVLSRRADITAAATDLGWRPSVTLRTGIAKMLAEEKRNESP